MGTPTPGLQPRFPLHLLCTESPVATALLPSHDALRGRLLACAAQGCRDPVSSSEP